MDSREFMFPGGVGCLSVGLLLRLGGDVHVCVTCLVLGLIVCACVGFVVDWYGLILFTGVLLAGLIAVVGFCFEVRGCL